MNSDPFGVCPGKQCWEEVHFYFLYSYPVAPTFLQKGEEKNNVFKYFCVSVGDSDTDFPLLCKSKALSVKPSVS